MQAFEKFGDGPKLGISLVLQYPLLSVAVVAVVACLWMEGMKKGGGGGAKIAAVLGLKGREKWRCAPDVEWCLHDLHLKLLGGVNAVGKERAG